jgi:hypothetical protein
MLSSVSLSTFTATHYRRWPIFACTNSRVHWLDPYDILITCRILLIAAGLRVYIVVFSKSIVNLYKFHLLLQHFDSPTVYNQVKKMHPALAIPEILTLIFQECDHPTLLCRAQRVSRSWHNFIKSSTPLQQKLFFQSMPEDTYPTYNTFLAKKFPSWFATKHISFGIDALCTMEWAPEDEVLRYEKASWRDMLVVQPAATKLLIKELSSSQGGNSYRSGTKDVNDGVRMGLLYDYVSKKMEKTGSQSTFGVDWRGVEQYPWVDRPVHYPMTLLGLDDETDKEVKDNGGGKWDGVVKVNYGVLYPCCNDDIIYILEEFLSRGYKDLEEMEWSEDKQSDW